MADNQQSVRSQTSSESESEGTSQISDVQQNRTNASHAPVSVPRTNEQLLNVPLGVQTTSSFHSISSIDSSAEMAKYFPDANSPRGSVSKEEEKAGNQQATTHATVPAPTNVQQPLPQPAQAPVAVPQQQKIQPAPTAAPALPQGIPAYSSQVEGLSVAQVVVNDVIIDLQSKVINETQQQYYEDSSSGNYLEQLPPIYIRAPNPSIILRSDLQRLRAQLTARPPVITRGASGFNQFQGPSFPPPNQYTPSNSYGGY